jgi:hypothetical protein
LSKAESVVRGHVPRQLPHGFGLAQVAAVQPHDAGYVAWTDSACRRISVFFEPGVTTASGGAHAFGPWMRLQDCGAPRPCIVYQGAVGGGLVEFATWRLDPRTATAVLHSIRT